MSIQYSTSGEAKMMKKLFYSLSLFTLLSVSCFVVFLYFSNNSSLTLLTVKYYTGNGNISLSEMIQEHVETFWNLTDAANARQEKTQMPPNTSKSLGPCPDTPPGLVGPLHVDFNYKRTLDEVRKHISSPLKEGGRYKPPECIARQKVAIIIPFRNRHEHLKHWLYYLHPTLQRQQLDYGVYVINQDGEGVFNRAKLMNAGFLEALKEYDYDCFVFSDIDLVPMDDRNLYRCFQNPRHLAVAMDKFNFHLPYDNFFGGVSSLSKSQFLKINGFPNTYWGWGGEDDDIYNRVIFHDMSISRPDLVIGKYKMIKHVRDLHNEPNPVNPDKLRRTKWTMTEDGINSIKYTVKEIVKDILYTFITVDIQAPLTS